MKKWIAMMLAMLMVLSFVACGGGDNASSGDIGGGTEQTEPTPAPTPETTPEAKDGFGGANSEQLEQWKTHTVTTINFTLPEAMWVVVNKNDTLYLYNEESVDVSHSASPRIQFETKDSQESLDFYIDQFENLQDIDSRVIGGVEMSGRTYVQHNMEWIEYYAQLPNADWMSLKISRVDMTAGGEADTILNSVSFS